MGPNYKKIYHDMLMASNPSKLDIKEVANKINNIKAAIDVTNLNEMLFGSNVQSTNEINQNLKAYDEQSVMKILRYQKEYKLNNTQTAITFKLSKNTLCRWRLFYAKAI